MASANEAGLRIGDEERERVRAMLQRHVADGRLTLDEFGDRLDEVYAAHTAADLERAQRDLPALPAPAPAGRPAAERPALPEGVFRAAAVAVLLLVFWALTGAGYFWPIWPIMAMGLGLARQVRSGMPEGRRSSSTAASCRVISPRRRAISPNSTL